MVIMCPVIVKIYAGLLFYKVEIIWHSHAVDYFVVIVIYFVFTLNNYCYFKLLLSTN